VVPEHRYTVGVWYRSTRPVRLTVSVLDGTATWRTWLRGSAQPATDRWRRATLVTPAVPAGITKLTVGLALPAGTRMYADDASVTDAGAKPVPARSDVLFRASFPTADGLITNEFAHWNPNHADAQHSEQWDMTSGSLFASGGWAYTGPIDGRAPDARSKKHTDSAVFRLNTKARFNDVRVATTIRIGQFTSTPRTPAQAWDGVHLWLRYQTQYHLYVVSVARRDGRAVIKKKCPGGPSNDGTYHAISREVGGHPVAAGRSRTVAASVRTNANQTVTIELEVDGRRLMSATDNGIGCPAITTPGAVGIRADNTRFWFDDFTVVAS
jgi:hypothetical protein